MYIYFFYFKYLTKQSIKTSIHTHTLIDFNFYIYYLVDTGVSEHGLPRTSEGTVTLTSIWHKSTSSLHKNHFMIETFGKELYLGKCWRSDRLKDTGTSGSGCVFIYIVQRQNGQNQVMPGNIVDLAHFCSELQMK